MAIIEDGRSEEVDYVGVRDISGAVAGEVEGGIAGAMFGELVAPEGGVGLTLSDPESLGVREGEVSLGVLERVREEECALTCSSRPASRVCQKVRGRCRYQGPCKGGSLFHWEGRLWYWERALGRIAGYYAV